MEGDVAASAASAVIGAFQSTPSAWRETELPVFLFLGYAISIHSLRMEGDEQLYYLDCS